MPSNYGTYKRIIKNRISRKIAEFKQMSLEQKHTYCQEQADRMRLAASHQVLMAGRPPPAPGSSSHTVEETEEEWHRRMQDEEIRGRQPAGFSISLAQALLFLTPEQHLQFLSANPNIIIDENDHHSPQLIDEMHTHHASRVRLSATWNPPAAYIPLANTPAFFSARRVPFLNELLANGVTPGMLNSWQPPIIEPLGGEFDASHARAVLSLVRQQDLTPEQAMSEVNQLNWPQVKALEKCYARGVRNLHLQDLAQWQQTQYEGTLIFYEVYLAFEDCIIRQQMGIETAIETVKNMNLEALRIFTVD